jgi:hypothetical protein
MMAAFFGGEEFETVCFDSFILKRLFNGRGAPV